MAKDFAGACDLLGDPIPDNWGKRGRPQHLPTDQNRSKVRLLLAFGWTNPRIAQALRIDGKTLRKHYFRELRQRDEARPALEAQRLLLVYRAACEGNVGAMKELGRLIERDELDRPQPRPVAAPEKPAKLGKKEVADLEAQTAHQVGSWKGLVN